MPMTHQNWDFVRGRCSSRTVSRSPGRCRPTKGTAGAASLAGRGRCWQDEQPEAQSAEEPEEPDSKLSVTRATGQRGVTALIMPFLFSIPYR